MSSNPYSNFLKDELILRDKLAIDRTELANERTMLAYVRTTFALILAGISLFHFYHNMIGILGGIFFISSGWLVFYIGFKKYKEKNNNLKVFKYEITENSIQEEPNNLTKRALVKRLLYNYFS